MDSPQPDKNAISPVIPATSASSRKHILLSPSSIPTPTLTHTPIHRSSKSFSHTHKNPSYDIESSDTESILLKSPTASEIRSVHGDESLASPTFSQHEKHFFVTTMAGKPVFTKYGSAERLAGLLGAIMAVAESFRARQKQDNLWSVETNDTDLIFIRKDPLILCCASKTQQPQSVIIRQLHLLHSHIVGAITEQFTALLDARPGFDLRPMIEPLDEYLTGGCLRTDHDLSYLLGSPRSMAVDMSIRDAALSAMTAERTPRVLFSVLYHCRSVIAVWQLPSRPLHQLDLLIALSRMEHAMEGDVAWTEVCLPHLSPKAWLYALSTPLVAGGPRLALITHCKEARGELELVTTRVAEKLGAKTITSPLLAAKCKQFKVSPGISALDHLHTSSEVPFYLTGSVGITGLVHFVCKHHGKVQLTSPVLEPPYLGRSETERLLGVYECVLAELGSGCKNTTSEGDQMDPLGAALKGPRRCMVRESDLEVVVGLRTQRMVLVACFGPFVPSHDAVVGAEKLSVWVEGHIDELFYSVSK
eukprot:gnl/Dysnectes_brevis/6976_a11301_301.p1 GENE.gnl/Dysnectes_brevis/6976_a11301_301~~gnl/Dysnectes_brevis/6976_a11301_301.p1  ORF type:complete len:532 (+),score=99.77 gnl/Dysnectes_brevis/6976_a11301_301:54-1649(+)